MTSCLNSPVPTVFLWGEKKRVVACNDRYVTMSGGKIPLGLRGMTIQGSNSSFHKPGSVRSSDEEFFLIDELGSSTNSKMKAVVIPVFQDSGKPGGKLVCLVEAFNAEPKSITMSVISDFGVRLLRSESSHRLWRNVLEWLRQMKGYFPKPMIYLPSTTSKSLDGREKTLELVPLDAPAVGDAAGCPPAFRIPGSAREAGLSTKQAALAECWHSRTFFCTEFMDDEAARSYAIPIAQRGEGGDAPPLAILYFESDLKISNEEYAGSLELIRNEILKAFANLTDWSRQSALPIDGCPMKTSAQDEIYRFPRMAEKSPIALYRTNSTGMLIYWNETYLKLLGVTREVFEDRARIYGSYREAARRNCYWEDVERLLKDYAGIFAERKPFQMEYRIVQEGTGKILWIRSENAVDFDEEGNFHGYVFAMIDITEKRRLEEEKVLSLQREEAAQRRRADEAEESRHQQETFIDMVCHEIRNPLNGIANNNEFTAEAMEEMRAWAEARVPFDDEFRAAFTRGLQATSAIALCAKHMKHIADDVLNLSKIGLNLLSVSSTMPYDPHGMLTDLMATFRADLTHKGIASSVRASEHYLARSRAVSTHFGDPARLTQVIINLVTNAIKFTEREPVRRIDVMLDLVGEEGPIPGSIEEEKGLFRRRLAFSVTDSGIGMDEVEKKKLFKKFSQASIKTYSQYGGSGLGLFISKKIIELMGGSIDVVSEKGKGCTFTFTINCTARPALEPPPPLPTAINPLHKPEVVIPSPNPPPSTTLPPTLQQPTSQSDLRFILIVDDNEINREILAKHLMKLGHATRAATDGLQAVDLLTESYEAYKLVLMDMEMPVMDGRTASLRIRAMEAANGVALPLPIIAVTGNARTEQVRHAMDAGIDNDSPFA
ncbi:hypothetical protein HK101_002714 [Irineochytrium annulatum]|nr:hypothetical protein HK101_002714 [Irineochytrium annulatum]